jgi:hypothetical protein
MNKLPPPLPFAALAAVFAFAAADRALAESALADAVANGRLEAAY